MPIYNPLHPGKIVYDVIINGAGLSVTEAADNLGVNRTTLSRLLNGHAGISAEMALRLSKLLPNTDMTLWMNLQRDYDIWVAKKYSSKIHVKPLEAA
jgi:addiction module HigA family antidote